MATRRRAADSNRLIAEAEAERVRLFELERAKRDLYFLAGKLGYLWTPEKQQGITPHFHKPMCDWWVENDDTDRLGLFMQRKGCKTSVFTVCDIVRNVLIDPDLCFLVLHMSEDEANGIVAEAGELFMSNDWLRSLDPIGVYPKGHKKAGQPYNVCPDRRVKKFVTSSGWTIKTRPKMNVTTRRQPTCVGKGLTSTLTGLHVDRVYYDDIIGHETLADGTGMSKARAVMQNTVENVLNATGHIRCVGTRWDQHDVYATEMMKRGRGWKIRVRHAIELEDGSPGTISPSGEILSGTPTHYGPTPSGGDGIKEAIARERKEMLRQGYAQYMAQRMNDPSPPGEKPWHADDCEHYVELREAAGDGMVFVVSDPAPAATGSYDETGMKARGDGTKDEWALAVVKIQVWRGVQRAVLLDLMSSREWDISEGFGHALDLMQKWRTNKLFNESYGGLGADYTDQVKSLARARGMSVYFDAKTRKLPRFENSYVKGAKNVRFAKLADWARSGRFVVARESVPEAELEKFLDQARGWRPLPNGRNSNRYDDVADAVSRCTDAALQRFAPGAPFMNEKTDGVFNSGPFKRPEKPVESLCRYWHV